MCFKTTNVDTKNLIKIELLMAKVAEACKNTLIFIIGALDEY